jgi:hypothetical protein
LWSHATFDIDVFVILGCLGIIGADAGTTVRGLATACAARRAGIRPLAPATARASLTAAAGSPAFLTRHGYWCIRATGTLAFRRKLGSRTAAA